MAIYELFLPYTDHSAIQYVVIVKDNGKVYGYKKYKGDKQAKYQNFPFTKYLRFAGYMNEKNFNEFVFIDLL